MPFARFLILMLTLAVFTFCSGGTVLANGWGVFSAELRKSIARLDELRTEYEELGALRLRQTVQQAGAQLHMGTTPPPQSPWIQLDLGRPQTFDRIVIVPAISGAVNDGIRPYAFPRRFRIDGSLTEDFGSYRLLYDSGDQQLDIDSPFPVVVKTPDVRVRYVRVTVTELAEVAGRWTYALSEVMVIRGDQNLALNVDVTMTGATMLPPVWLPKYLVDGRTPLGPQIRSLHEGESLPKFDGVFLRSDNPSDLVWFQIDLEETRRFDAIRLFPVHARQGADYPGYAFPSRFRIEVSDDNNFETSDVLFQTDTPFEPPGNNPVTFSTPDAVGRYVRIAIEQGSLPNTNKVGLSEAQVLRGSENLAFAKPVTALHWRGDRALSLLVDGEASYGPITTLLQWVDRWAATRQLQQEMSTATDTIERQTIIARDRARRIAMAGIGISAIIVGLLLWQQRNRRGRQRAEFRLRLAQDLHDEIGSNLAAISRIGELGEAIESDDQSKEDWHSVRELASECNDSMRETLWLLGGPKRSQEHLADQLRSIAKRMLPGVALVWKLDCAFEDFRPNENIEREIILIFKAMLANIARSSNATEVVVEGSESMQRWRISVQDNGDGFDAVAWENKMEPRGMGLQSMKTRIRKLGGSLVIESQPGEGTQLTIEMQK
ncbi:MAG: discoidin domain-containing protein [Rhodopirellula sp. JB044]|uniref:discoidin domain-containing protein n=1 Tax=Rhodopirellula sp. JB044 TaxID=3342844 RepID=UPI00370BE7A2